MAWSHGSRFALACRLVVACGGRRLLDYGCGDGTFVAMVHDRFPETRGVDVDPDQIAGCQTRLGDLPGVTFGMTPQLRPADAGAWNVVTCMEVLEHCLDADRRGVIEELGRLCARDGRIVISIPIETGPSVVAKQSFRAIAGLRRLGDYAYRERYSIPEMVRAAAGRRVERVTYEGRGATGTFAYYGHKGFEWSDVEREIRERLIVERRTFSPMPWMAAVLNSQVWFICRPRP